MSKTTMTTPMASSTPRKPTRKSIERIVPGLLGWLEADGRDIEAELAELVPPLHMTPAPSTAARAAGVHFDLDAVVRFIRFARKLRHIKGRKFAGRRLELDLWQLVYVFGPVLGWKGADGLRLYQELFEEVPRKNGKALDPSTPIATPSGWSIMGALAVGDEVFGDDGAPCSVTDVADWIDRPRFAVTLDDGDTIVADAAHEWVVTIWGYDRIVTTLDLEGLVAGTGSPSIDVARPLELPPVLLPVDPYTLGVWLGDGATDCGRVTNADPEVWDGIRESWRVGDPPPSAPLTRTVYGLAAHLRSIGVLGAKHIPLVYLRAGIEQRRAVLAGVIDSDGHVTQSGQCEITLTNARLMDDVVALVRTLGYKPRVSESAAVLDGREVGRRYRLSFFPWADDKLARIPRKAARMRDRPESRTRSMRRHVTAVTPIDPGPTRCIEVDSPSHLFLAGASMTPTHNSTNCAALALYLLSADREPGAEVISAAKDRAQARAVFDVAARMAEKSPELSKRLHITRLTGAITFEATASTYNVVSSDRGGDRKHGLNLHGAIVDELHVITDRELIGTLETSTGSREQPLIAYITTAGIESESPVWAEKRKAVVDASAGVTVTGGTWGVIFAAAPKVATSGAWKLEETWRAANPGYGRSVRPEYLKKEALKAERSAAALNRFLRLHLGIPQDALSSWVDIGAYDRSASIVDELELHGQRCYAGLDLSSSLDLSALVLVFPDEADETIDVMARFWTPGDTLEARSTKDRADYGAWRDAGFLTATPGETINLDFVEAELLELLHGHDLRAVGYDPWGSLQLRSHLEEAGVPIFDVRQGFASLSPPMKLAEALIYERRLRHGGHPVLRFCISNTTVALDPAGNIKPDRKRSRSRIDGTLALLMALSEWQRDVAGGRSAYEDRDVDVVAG